MARKIVIIQGHPDRAARHFGHALADAYARGAELAGHEIRRVEVAELEFTWLHSQTEWNDGFVPVGLRDAQAAIGWADHVVLVFPLWLGTMPAMLKAFLEQVLRPGFAFRPEEPRRAQKALAGKSARIVVTMGLPSLRYRWAHGAHGIKGLEHTILSCCGFGDVGETMIGGVETKTKAAGEKWLERLTKLGRNAA